MHASDYETLTACNCLKDERKRLAVRRYAGVFVVVLPCGYILTLHHLVGAESLPQVTHCFAEALALTQGKKFICYDNACALARFCRNPVRADKLHIFRDCLFVLPESHLRGHTACLDPDHPFFLPEVRKTAHPELHGVNTEAQEHVFAWARWLVHVANPMTPVRHRIFFLLLCLARNHHRGLCVRSRRPRPHRNWNIWRGVAVASPVAGPVLSGDPAVPVHQVVPAEPPAVPAAPSLPATFLLNLRDNKLHRLAAPLRLACGTALPKHWRYLASRDEVARTKLCLRNGCFSPGAGT